MKRFLTLIPVLVFCLLCAPAVLADTVETTYLDKNNATVTCDNATVVTDTDSSWTNGWYVVQGDVTITGDVTVDGNVRLILTDGARLTVNGSIVVERNNTFTVYGQSTDMNTMGRLEVNSAGDNAAIGSGSFSDGGNVTIFGGDVEATSYAYGAAIGSGNGGIGITVNIFGGMITATSNGPSAAIGGGRQCIGGAVNISGGTVIATGNSTGAAIGSGETGTGGTVNISGGTINAVSYAEGAAIGGGGSSIDITVDISGGTIIAMSEKFGASIGGGDSNTGGIVTISGGDVTATSNGQGSAIGDGFAGIGTSVTLSGGTVTAFGVNYNNAFIGTVTANPVKGQFLAASAGRNADDAVPLEGSPFTAEADITRLASGKPWFHSETVQMVSVDYLDESGASMTCDNALVVTDSDNTWSDGWYVAQGNLTLTGDVTVNGDVRMILADGANLTVNGSIVVEEGNTFTVYGQSTGDTMGCLIVDSSKAAAAIGGRDWGVTGTVSICGGNVTASNNMSGAAIGGGSQGNEGIVNISGGVVTANGKSGAAIGNGDMGNGVTVNISGGTVMATSGLSAAAIGDSSVNSSCTVNISGGTVSAINTLSGPAIKSDSITISGGTVTASSTSLDVIVGSMTMDPAAGMLLAAAVGDSEATASQMEGSPFAEKTDITNLVSNQHWFHSETVYLVTGITLDQTALTLEENGTATLTGTVTPDNATNPALRWTSSDENVATVSDNAKSTGMVVITAKAPGTAVITAEATDGSGVQARCTVTVKAAPVSTKTPDSTADSGNSDSSGSAAPVITPTPTPAVQINYYTCPVCGTHNWTATDGGYRCDNCGYLETEHSLSGYGNVKGVQESAARNGTSGGSTAAASIPQTGDESNPTLWLGLLVVSALALGGVSFLKRKNNI